MQFYIFYRISSKREYVVPITIIINTNIKCCWVIFLKGFIIKTGLILALGVFVSVIIYPILHEAGHILCALIFGVKIEEINLFSGVNILCSVNIADKSKVIFTGYGGILFPMIISVVIRSKKFVIWCTIFFLRIINIFSIFVSVFSLLSFLSDKPLKADDISTILTIDNRFLSFTALLLVFCFIAVILTLLKDTPLKQFDRFYYSKNQTA